MHEDNVLNRWNVDYIYNVEMQLCKCNYDYKRNIWLSQEN